MCGREGREGEKKGMKTGAVTETYSKLNKNKALKPNRSMDHSLMFTGGKQQEVVGKILI